MNAGRRFEASAAAGVLALLLGTTPAAAGGKFLGETVVYVGDGGHDAWMIGRSQDIGYKYEYVAFLWLDLWSWGGTYCVHQRFEHKYVPISPAQAAQLLKRDEASLRPPFWYRYPAGLLVFGSLGALAGIARAIRGPVPRDATDRPAAPGPDPT